jgi:hypothetical protein
MSARIHNCGSCGAPIKIDQSLDKNICSFCSNEILQTKSINFLLGEYKGDDKDLVKLQNLLILLEDAQESQSYKEGLDYCNKALEIDPTNPKLWEYKAICYFWSINNRITKNEIDQIYKFLKNSKKYTRESDSNDTFNILANNLYANMYYSYLKLDYDKSLSGKIWDSFSERSINLIIDFIKTMEICFDLYPEQKFLDASIRELSGYNKLNWIIKEDGNLKISDWVKTYSFDPIQVRDFQIDQIKKVYHNYVIPDINNQRTLPLTTSNSRCFIATACYENPNHKDLRVLRKFRDSVLLKTQIGINFILFYYRHGPSVSSFVSKNNFLKLLLLNLIIRPLAFIINIFYNRLN